MRALRTWSARVVVAAASLGLPGCAAVADDPGEGGEQPVLDPSTPPADPVLYVGLNSTSKTDELRGLRSATEVVGVMGEKENGTVRLGDRTLDLRTPAGRDAFVAHFRALDDKAREVVRSIVTVPHAILIPSQDELAQILLAFYDAETGARPIRRVVLSGHSRGQSLSGEGATDGTLHFFVLERLRLAFPKAIAGIEHLAISGCTTAADDDNPDRWIFDQYLRSFPNLRSIWAYKGNSPTIPGSTEHVKAWERGTRRADRASLDAARRDAARHGGANGTHVRIWLAEGGILGER